MGIGLGLIAGGAAKGYQEYQDILAKRAQTDAQQLQNKAARQKLDDADLADQIANLAPGADVGPVTAAHQAALTARDAEANQTPLARIAGAIHRIPTAITAASAGVGAPPPTLGVAPAPTATALAAAPSPAAPVPAPVAPASPAAAPGLPLGGTPPAAAAPAAPASPTDLHPDTGLPLDVHAPDMANGNPASTAAGGSNTRMARAKITAEEQGYMRLAQIAHAQRDYKGAMDATQKAAEAHANGVIKDLQFATPATMSNVLTDQAGVKREVQENNGQYAIFDENGKLLEKYPSRTALMAGAMTAMKSDPTAGISLMTSLQKDARDQMTAEANVKRMGAESEALTGELQLKSNADRRAGRKSAQEDIDWQQAHDDAAYLSDPNNKVLHPVEWAGATQRQTALHPHMLTQDQAMDSQGNVVRTSTNQFDNTVAPYVKAIGADPGVKANVIAVAPDQDGNPSYWVKGKDGVAKPFQKFDKASQEARTIYPELYKIGAKAGAPDGAQPRNVRGLGLGGKNTPRPAAAPAAAAPAPAAAPPAAAAPTQTEAQLLARQAQLQKIVRDTNANGDMKAQSAILPELLHVNTALKAISDQRGAARKTAAGVGIARSAARAPEYAPSPGTD